MIRPIFALLGSTLAEDCRKGRTYLTRAALSAAVMLLLVGAYRAFARAGAPGKDLFVIVVRTNLFFLSLGAIVYLSSVVAEEKEGQTLGLLRMTRLNPVSILLGKGISRTISLAFLVLIQVPFTLLAITMGGVSLPQVIASYAAVLAYVALLAGLGLFCSVVMDRVLTAMALTAVVLGAFLSCRYGLLLMVRKSSLFPSEIVVPLHVVCSAVVRLDPFKRFEAIMTSGFGGPLIDIQAWGDLGIGAVLFLAAWALFDPLTREEKVPAPPRGTTLVGFRAFRWLRVGPVWRDAIAWKDFHFIGGSRAGIMARIAVLGVLFVWLLGRWVMSFPDWPLRRYYFPHFMREPLAVFSIVLAADLALTASRLFAAEVRWDTWPPLMVLPRSLFQTVRGKLNAAVIELAPAAMAWWAVVIIVQNFLPPENNMRWTAAAAGVDMLLFAHIVVIASLCTPYGAVPIAVMVYILGFWIIPNALRWPILSTSDWLTTGAREYRPFGLLLRFALMGVMARATMRRLRRLAGA
jgi:hypothetical protein